MDETTLDQEFEAFQETSEKKQKPKQGPLRVVLEFVIAIVVALTAAWLLRTFVFMSFEVPSASMESTFMVNDKFMADMLFYKFGELKKEDIVCFDDMTQPDRILVKRVIATAGQEIMIDDTGIVSVDGVNLLEPYVYDPATGRHGEQITKPLNNQFQGVEITYPYTVPEGHIWVMGDNRTNSQDSRYFGPVPEDAVLGKALFVFWPLDRMALL